MPDSLREMIAIPIKKIQENVVPEKSPGKKNPETSQGKNTGKKSEVKKDRKPEVRPEPFSGKKCPFSPAFADEIVPGSVSLL